MNKAIIRTLSQTDVVKAGAHGAEPPIPKDKTEEFEEFFGGIGVKHSFIDVTTKKEYELHITNYASSKTPHRIAPIRKYRTAHSLEIGDQIILEKIERPDDSLYLIDYLKKACVVSIYGCASEKGIVNQEKLEALLEKRVSEGQATLLSQGVYEVNGKYKKNSGVYKILIQAGEVELFFNNNAKTAFSVGQARGVILLAAKQHNLPFFEYTPLQVKQSVVGYGRAEKKQVMEMVKMFLHLDKVPKLDDTADALALAICHAHASESKLQGFYNLKKEKLL